MLTSFIILTSVMVLTDASKIPVVSDDIDQVVENEMAESAKDIDISSADQHDENVILSKDGKFVMMI